MADRKFSVEDILKEYGETDGKGSSSVKPSGRLETQQLLRHTEPGKKLRIGDEQTSSYRRADSESKINRIKQEVRTSGRADIESSRAAAFQTLELMREKVSFVNSAAANPHTAPAQKNDRIEGYEGAVRVEAPVSTDNKVHTAYIPNIRAMEDSTRAKEEKESKGKKKKDTENRHSYKRDTLVGNEPKAEEEKPVDESKPFFFDLHHSGAAKLVSREAREERERRRRVAAIHRLRKKRMKMKELEEAEGQPTVHIPNNDSEIIANINTLRKSVLIRVGLLSVFFLAGVFLCVLEKIDGAVNGSVLSLLNLILGMAAAGVSFPTVANGLKYLVLNRSDSDSMAAAPITISVLGAAVSVLLPESLNRGEAHMFVPVAVFILLMNALGKLLIIKRAIKNFSVISGKYEQYILSYVSNESDAENLTRGVQPDYPILVSMRKAKRLSDFLRYTYSEDIGDRFCHRVTPFVCIGSLMIAAAITGIRFTVMPGNAVLSFFLSVFSMLLCGGCCAGVMMAANIPLHKAAASLSKRGCALLGYQSVDDFYDSNTLLVRASELFGESNVDIDGMKAFRDAKIEDVILVCTGLARQADSVLVHAFSKMLDEQNSSIPYAESVMYEEGYGISGWVKNRRVLLGNREMMEAHSIEGLPSPMREAEYAGEGKEVLYYSVSGMVSAMMLVKVTSSNRMRDMVHKLLDENINLVVKSCDSFLTQQYIAGLFNITENSIKVLPIALHETFNKYTEPSDFVSASVIATGKSEDTVRLLLAARKIRRSATTGIMLQAASVIIGLAIALIYIGLSAYTSVSAGMFLIFQLAATAITAVAVRIK